MSQLPAGSGGMLLRKIFKLKSPEMTKNCIKNCQHFSFEVRSQPFSLALTFDQNNRLTDEAKIFDLFSIESQQLVETQFRCSCFRKSDVLLYSL